ncbi:hypothetical protein [Mycoplasmopsis gallinarum]|uniref:Uncharacterized protein n=1 Tax=Mycoplasmopsis gallinarum TaxID=29557 RepID=A0A168RD63_9BACT|nr:hypothetical protein [Mycoplasmopsis gallinarum]OAB48858.1 hypothetical protein MGALLINA_04290 [Mycoplasmopsis gallinarum]
MTESETLISQYQDEDDQTMREKIEALTAQLTISKADKDNQYISLEAINASFDNLTTKKNEFDQYAQEYNRKKELIRFAQEKRGEFSSQVQDIRSRIESLSHDLKEGGEAKSKFDSEVQPKFSLIESAFLKLEELSNQRPSEIEDSYEQQVQTLTEDITNRKTEVEQAIQEVEQLKQQEAEQPTENS